jgi:hypothetical protein
MGNNLTHFFSCSVLKDGGFADDIKVVVTPINSTFSQLFWLGIIILKLRVLTDWF